MKTINISISDKDFTNYGLNSDNLSFKELEDKIRRKTIRESLYSCQKIAEQAGLSNMSLEDINKEVQAVRENNAKDNS